MESAITPRRLFPICPALLIALAALLSAGAPATGSPARAWLTTGDRANLLDEQPAGALGAPMPDAPTISVDPAHSYQRIEGLGASITDSSAHLLARSPHRDEIMIVLVVVNDDWGTTAQSFNVSGSGDPFSYTLPAGAIATFVLRP
ncbi:MAG TPA: glycoside hydrolase family 30 beta sandwich domain-containing protein [Solirubrobacteraceae bacterium]|nr:glycoside hydrolase family 30 beta sandwich domain-containing protein [Solirubrobacteraceae bacterium]